MIRSLVDLIRRAVGTPMLVARLDQQEALTRELAAGLSRQGVPTDAGLQILPGTPYSRFALPIEYPPSRDLRPRWGNTHPPLKPIVDWIQPHQATYRGWLDAITRRAAQLDKVAREFDPANLPEPAWLGVPYSPIDAAALYAIIGETRPKLYLEIGSGVTTAWAYRSIRDHGLSTRIVSVDPEPRAAIDSICDEVVRAGLETCDLAVFDQLEPGDILFMDGSHRSYMNSDVTVFMLEVLPRVKPGVLIHVHDIQLPWDYPEWAVPWYWNEAYMLATYVVAAADRLTPVLPTTWVCQDAAFADWFAKPPVDLSAQGGDWRGGGAFWFTHAR
jgi:predicted O-methyltransferase YrrM